MKCPYGTFLPFPFPSFLPFPSFSFCPFSVPGSPRQIRLWDLGSAVTWAPPAGSGGACRTDGVWCILSCENRAARAIALLQKSSDNPVRIVTDIGPATHGHGISQERNGGMVWSLRRKCRYGIPSHTVPLPAQGTVSPQWSLSVLFFLLFLDAWVNKRACQTWGSQKWGQWAVAVSFSWRLVAVEVGRARTHGASYLTPPC